MTSRLSMHNLILLLTLFTALQTTTTNAVENTTEPIFMCSSSAYTTNSSYSANLNQLFADFRSKTPITGYSNLSVGAAPDRVFGTALCRGDISSDQCLQCLNAAIPFVQQCCPQKKLGVSRMEKCMLYYANRTIDYQHSMSPDFFLSSPSVECGDGTATDLQPFQESLQSMMQELISFAAYKSETMFSTGQTNYSSSSMLYGLVMCTRDLTPTECDNCLTVSLGYVSDFCWGNEGASVVFLKCMLRFESYSFINQSSTATLTGPQSPVAAGQTPPPAQLSSPGKRKGLSNSEKVAVIGIPLISGFACAMAILVLFLWRRRRYIVSISSTGDEEKRQSTTRLFNLSMLRAATNNFSYENKVGEGGFGAVYKGVLTDGLEVAVKRLSKRSKQGLLELRNEVVFVVKLQHKNLVRLLGCCLEEKEKLLIYEFLSNLSLDKFLFDPSKHGELDWQSRYKIIEGIARGLLYLHEDSRLTIVHRDLKASNILLDEHMNPKISDFGLAKLFDDDKSRGTTSHIAGTNGYMAPEYVMFGQFSTKSDVYSFGVLVLEIITGQRITNFQSSEQSTNLLSYAWSCWSEERARDIIDTSLGELHYHEQEVLRCIHIGLLCVQEEPTKRPNMAAVVLMLNSYSVTLPSPSIPGFFIKGNAADGVLHNSDSETKEDKDMNGKSSPTDGVSTIYVTITTMEPR